MHRNSYRDIIRWLAPVNYEASYFVDDLTLANKLRHSGTCTWILNRPEFITWICSRSDELNTRILWFTGIPGVGKTVLSSFVINKCSEISGNEPSSPTFYFFFKNTDNDKNSMLAVARSLVYQLYLLAPARLSTDLISLRDSSGKEKALSERNLWNLFVKYANDLGSFTIVLDALDECNDVDLLLENIIILLQCCHVRLFVVSRKEENIALALEAYPRVEIRQGDIEADIRSYITAEIENIPRFKGKPVQKRMINSLTSGHGGMFLWAYLMIKELKELGTVRQVDDALKALPTGLQQMHELIITRLDHTLHRAHRELSIKILKWIVCAVRPLRLGELQEILRFEVRPGGSASQPLDNDDDDDDLLYSEKEIELACGALVVHRNGSIQLIHLSTREILMGKPPSMHLEDSRRDFYVDGQRENPHMAMLCVSYLDTHLSGIGSVMRPNIKTESRLLSPNKDSFDSTELVKKLPFIDYASISWQVHLIDGNIDLELESIMHRLQALLTYDLTSLWIELCVLLHQDIIWTLQRDCNEIMSWADTTLVPAESSCHQAIGFLRTWSGVVMSIINKYGHVIEEHPYEIQYLDLESVPLDDYAASENAPPLSFASRRGQAIREKISVISAADPRQPKMKADLSRQLQSNLQDPLYNGFLGFVLYDMTRSVFFSAERFISNGIEVLRVQERNSGRRLQPIKSTLKPTNTIREDSGPRETCSYLHTAVLSPDCLYLAILYTNSNESGYFVTSVWKIERHFSFRNIRDRRPWAHRLHCFETSNSAFVDSSLALTVGQDGFFYCPSGKIHPDYGVQKQIPDLFVTNREDPLWNMELAFAGNGQTLIKLNQSFQPVVVEKISWLADTVSESLYSGVLHKAGDPWPVPRQRLKAISQTARFVVYQSPQPHVGPLLFYLLDTMLSTQRFLVQYDQRPSFEEFFFSKDEKYILGYSLLHG